MATVVDDDDAWLYGESNEEKKLELDRITERLNEDTNGDPNTEFNSEDVLTKELPRLDEYSNSNKGYEATDQRNTYSYNCKTLDGEEDKEAGELSGEEENKEVIHTEDQGSEDSDSDDDDAVQVTIGDIKPPSYNYGGTPVNLNIKRGGAFGSGTATGPSSKSKGIDMDSLGSINGVPVYEFNLDTLEDKPWRKPGADLTDYFNYGFNEDSWKIYCERQRKLRLDNNVVSKTQPVSGKDQQIPVATVNENSKYSGLGGLTKKAGPPPGRKMSGSIDVIGGGAPSLPSRRPASSPRENVIQVIGRKGSFEPPPGMPPLHLPPPHIPPPFLLPPPDHNISIPPPPGPIPPPGLPPPSIPPPPPGRVVPNQDGTFQDSFDSFQQTPFIPPHSFSGSDHSSRFDEMSSFYNGNQVSHNQFDIASESTQQSWNNSPRDTERSRERERDRDRERDERDRDREHERGRGRGRGRGSYTQWEFARDRSSARSGTGDEEHERRRFRGEYHDRPRERERDREHSHDRDRERDERYERDRERRHRDHHRERDDRYRERSSRRRHQHDDEDSDRRSSRHKHKRSKREKEEGSAAAAAAEAQESETANSSAGGGGGTNSAAEDGEEKSS